MKAIVPVAGLGTRMLPATKAIPKEMLAVVDKPIIQYVVEEIAAAGIKDIVLVTHSSKNSIANHFDTQFELETILERRVKRQLLEEVQSITPKGTHLIHIRQGRALGLGHAILEAQPVVGDEPCIVVLPDVLLETGSKEGAISSNLRAMIDRYEATGASQIMVNPVPREQVSSFGVVDIDEVDIQPGESAPIRELVEKPPIERAPSNLAITGRYVLDAKIWNMFDLTPVGVGEEIQLTDAIQELLKSGEKVEAYGVVGKSHDCGNKLGLAIANLDYGLRNQEIGEDLANYIQQLAAQAKPLADD
ncbi:MAG: UTP--glucose-1-phosphate uridylyltransferase GalU [Immundisolibacteraceae bacterium]|nr:UTP--glucose-1-phosphate uridylyltransferase GalU [Immundisolibacteraceae bacterium]